MLEKDIEKVLTSEVRKIGGRAYKFVSPGNDGVPDRLVIFPCGQTVFVELKTGTGKLSELQKVQCMRLRVLKQKVRVTYGVLEVADLFEEFGYIETAERIRGRYDI